MKNVQGRRVAYSVAHASICALLLNLSDPVCRIGFSLVVPVDVDKRHV